MKTQDPAGPTVLFGAAARRSALLAAVAAAGLAAGYRDASAHVPYPRRPIIVPIRCATPYPTPAGLPLPPGVTPPPTAAPLPSPTPGGGASAATYRVCPQAAAEIPADLQARALAEPWTIYGYGLLANPNTRHHPLWNDYRKWLSVRTMSLPYGPCNPAVWKAGCP